MKKFQLILTISTLILILFVLTKLNYSNLSWNNNELNYGRIITGIIIIIAANARIVEKIIKKYTNLKIE